MYYFILPLLFASASALLRRRSADYVLLAVNGVINLIFTLYILFVNQISTKFIAVDSLNKPFLFVLSLVFFASSIYSVEFLKKNNPDNTWHSVYTVCFILFDLLMMLSLMAQHIGLYWVLLEATTILTAPLIYFSKTKHSLEAAWKYVFICSIGIAIGFLGIIFLSITFKHADSLFFADFYNYTDGVTPLFLKISFLFILIGFGTKMGLAPLHFWLPDAHSEAPSPVSAMLSATLLNTALIGIIRVLKVMYIFNAEHFAGTMLVVMGILSIFVSTVFILRIKNYKRMLAYSSVENMGIIALSLGSGGLGLLAGMIHLLGHSMMKASLFLTTGNILEKYKTKHYDETGNVFNDMKKTGIIFLLSALGILGIPSSLSFLSEFLLVKNLLEKSMYLELAVILVLLTALFYGFMKMVITMLFSGEKSGKSDESLPGYIPQIILILVCFLLGFYMPEPVKEMLENAAHWIGRK
ncbi:MAG: proton-conducting transporter membrane subunit [bacterium]